MEIKQSYRLLVIIYLGLLAASVLTLFIFRNAFYKTPFRISSTVSLELIVHSIYFFAGSTIYLASKRFAKNERTTEIILKTLLWIGLILFFLTLTGYVSVYSFDRESKKEYGLAENEAFQIIERIEEHKQSDGSYPANLTQVFEEGDHALEVIRQSESELVFKWQSDRHTHVYDQLDDGSSYSFEFYIDDWWHFFVYDGSAKRFFAEE
jgi:hypothetical protein